MAFQRDHYMLFINGIAIQQFIHLRNLVINRSYTSLSWRLPKTASSSPVDRSCALLTIDKRHIAYVPVAGWMNLKALTLSE